MYQQHHRVCLICHRSVERTRRHTLTQDLQNEHQHAVQNIISAVTREVSTYTFHLTILLAILRYIVTPNKHRARNIINVR